MLSLSKCHSLLRRNTNIRIAVAAVQNNINNDNMVIEASRMMFSTSPSTTTTPSTTPSTPPPTTPPTTINTKTTVWGSPKRTDMKKVRALFKRIIWLDCIEMVMLNMECNGRLGKEMTPYIEPNLNNDAAVEKEVVVEDEGPKLVDLKLVGYNAKSKIKVIKEVRSMVDGLGLKEAKEMVENAPTTIKKELKPEDAEELKKKLEAIGAQIELS